MKSTGKDLAKVPGEQRDLQGFVRAKKKTLVINSQDVKEIRQKAACLEALRTFKWDQGQLEVWRMLDGRPEGFRAESRRGPGPKALPSEPSSSTASLRVTSKAVVAALISYDRDPLGEIISLNSGWLLITSEPSEAGKFLQIEDETISPSHAILSISERGEISVMDRFSTYGTKIVSADGATKHVGDRMEKLIPGDRVFFGNRSFSILGSNPEV
jgi:hypothetical protein